MPILRSVVVVCVKCKKTFTRMQGDVITPQDLNPLCTGCTFKGVQNIGRRMAKLLKPKKL